MKTRREKRFEAQRQILHHFEEKLPYFTDIFDERTFYICFFCLVVFCIVLAVVLSIFCKVTITDADEIERRREEPRRIKQKRLAEKLLRKKLKEKNGGVEPNIEINPDDLDDIIDRIDKNMELPESKDD
jgi:hypothetical protein